MAVPEPALNRLLIHLYNGSTHSQQPDQPQLYSVSTFAESVVAVALPAVPSGEDARRNADLGLGALWDASQQGSNWRTARADFHRRLALPVACLIFGLVALPLGLLAQRLGHERIRVQVWAQLRHHRPRRVQRRRIVRRADVHRGRTHHENSFQ